MNWTMATGLRGGNHCIDDLMTGEASTNPYRPYINASDYVPPWDPQRQQPQHPQPRHDLLADLDIGGAGMEESDDLWTILHDLTSTFLLQYASLLIIHPFEAAQTRLQCQMIPKSSSSRRKREKEDEEEEEEDDECDSASTTSSLDGPDYFEPLPAEDSAVRRTDRRGYIMEDAAESSPWQLSSKPRSVLEMIRDTYALEGVMGVWRGQTCAVAYNFLSSTLSVWLTHVIRASVSTMPDELWDEQHSLVSTGASIASSALTALVLAPLDIWRTRTILKSRDSTNGSGSSSSILFCPRDLILPTLITSVLPALVSGSMLAFAYRRFGRTYSERPMVYTLTVAATSILDLTLRLPLETVLRRAQANGARHKKRIVDVGPYHGTILGTMLAIARYEHGGFVGGLLRGWTLSVAGLCGGLGLGLGVGLGVWPMNEEVVF